MMKSIPWRLFGRLIIWTMISIVSFVLILFGLFQNSRFKNQVLAYVIESVEESTGWQIEVENVGGFLPFHLAASHVAIKQEGVPYLHIDRLQMAVSMMSLLRGHFVIHFVDADGVQVYAFPANKASNSQAPSSPLKRPPCYFCVERFRIHQLDLPIQGVSTYDLRGRLKIDPETQSYTAYASIRDLQTDSAPMDFAVAIRKEGDRLAVNGDLTEPIHGLLQRHFQVSVPIGAKLSFYAEGATESWRAFAANSHTDSPITGEFTLHSSHASHSSPSIQLGGIFQIEAKRRFLLNRLIGTLHLLGVNTQEPALISGQLEIDPQQEIRKGEIVITGCDLKALNAVVPLQAEGMISARCSLEGKLSAPSIHAICEGKNICLLHHPVEEASAKILISSKEGAVDGHLIANCTVSDVKLMAASHLSWEKPSLLKLTQFSIQLPSSELTGDLQLSLQNRMIVGSLAGKIRDLIPFSAILETPICGTLSLNAAFSYDINSQILPEQRLTQKLDIELQGNDLVFHDWEIDHLKLTSRLQNPFDSMKGTFILEGREISKGAASWKQLALETTIDREKAIWPFSFSSQGSWHGNTNLQSTGRWHANRQALDMHLDILDGIFATYSVSLQRPCHLNIERHAFALSPLQLSLGTGNVSLYAHAAGETLDASLQAQQFPLEILSHCCCPDLAISGIADLETVLQRTKNNLTGHLKGNFNEVGISEEIFPNLPPVKATIEAELSENTLVATCGIEGEDMQPIHLQAALPLGISLDPLEISIDPQAALSADIQAEGEITSLLQLMLADKISITGFAKAGFHIAGTWNKPQLQGQIEMHNCSYENLYTGAVFRDISLRLEGHNQEILMKDFTASDGKNGIVTGQGSLQLDSATSFPFDCEFSVSNAALISLDYAKLNSTGTLNYWGDLYEGSLEGELTVDKATITIPEEMPPQMKAIEVTYINMPPMIEGPYHGSKKRLRRPMNLDIKLNIPGGAYVNGRDLKSEWKGELAFTGTTVNPQVHGKTKLLNGEYLFNGRAFTSNRGMITFAGEPTKKTSVYITAELPIDDIRVELILKGLITEPVVSFRSNPPMTQKDILSWILFNRPVSDINPLQGAELSQSVFTLSGGGGGEDVLTKIRNSIGIDRVDISSTDTDDSNEVSLRVGKYISRGIFVSLNKSINADFNQVAIEAKLIRHFKIQAEVGDNAQGKLSLKWERDY